MSIKEWPAGGFTHAMRAMLACCLISFSTCTLAQTASPEGMVGRSYWYEPTHDKWVPTEFYTTTNFNSPLVRFTQKTRIQVMSARSGWFAIRPTPATVNAATVYMPAGMFRSRLYKPGVTGDAREAYAAFMRASLFEDDPDVIKRQFESRDDEPKDAPRLKPSTKLKPWQKYRENWGSVTPAPKKSKNILLDDIKQPEAATDGKPAADGTPAAETGTAADTRP